MSTSSIPPKRPRISRYGKPGERESTAASSSSGTSKTKSDTSSQIGTLISSTGRTRTVENQPSGIARAAVYVGQKLQSFVGGAASWAIAAVRIFLRPVKWAMENIIQPLQKPRGSRFNAAAYGSKWAPTTVRKEEEEKPADPQVSNTPTTSPKSITQPIASTEDDDNDFASGYSRDDESDYNDIFDSSAELADDEGEISSGEESESEEETSKNTESVRKQETLSNETATAPRLRRTVSETNLRQTNAGRPSLVRTTSWSGWSNSPIARKDPRQTLAFYASSEAEASSQRRKNPSISRASEEETESSKESTQTVYRISEGSKKTTEIRQLSEELQAQFPELKSKLEKAPTLLSQLEVYIADNSLDDDVIDEAAKKISEITKNANITPEELDALIKEFFKNFYEDLAIARSRGVQDLEEISSSEEKSDKEAGSISNEEGDFSSVIIIPHNASPRAMILVKNLTQELGPLTTADEVGSSDIDVAEQNTESAVVSKSEDVASESPLEEAQLKEDTINKKPSKRIRLWNLLKGLVSPSPKDSATMDQSDAMQALEAGVNLDDNELANVASILGGGTEAALPHIHKEDEKTSTLPNTTIEPTVEPKAESSRSPASPEARAAYKKSKLEMLAKQAAAERAKRAALIAEQDNLQDQVPSLTGQQNASLSPVEISSEASASTTIDVQQKDEEVVTFESSTVFAESVASSIPLPASLEIHTAFKEWEPEVRASQDQEEASSSAVETPAEPEASTTIGIQQADQEVATSEFSTVFAESIASSIPLPASPESLQVNNNLSRKDRMQLELAERKEARKNDALAANQTETKEKSQAANIEQTGQETVTPKFYIEIPEILKANFPEFQTESDITDEFFIQSYFYLFEDFDKSNDLGELGAAVDDLLISAENTGLSTDGFRKLMEILLEGYSGEINEESSSIKFHADVARRLEILAESLKPALNIEPSAVNKTTPTTPTAGETEPQSELARLWNQLTLPPTEEDSSAIGDSEPTQRTTIHIIDDDEPLVDGSKPEFSPEEIRSMQNRKATDFKLEEIEDLPFDLLIAKATELFLLNPQNLILPENIKKIIAFRDKINDIYVQNPPALSIEEATRNLLLLTQLFELTQFAEIGSITGIQKLATTDIITLSQIENLSAPALVKQITHVLQSPLTTNDVETLDAYISAAQEKLDSTELDEASRNDIAEMVLNLQYRRATLESLKKIDKTLEDAASVYIMYYDVVHNVLPRMEYKEVFDILQSDKLPSNNIERAIKLFKQYYSKGPIPLDADIFKLMYVDRDQPGKTRPDFGRIMWNIGQVIDQDFDLNSSIQSTRKNLLEKNADLDIDNFNMLYDLAEANLLPPSETKKFIELIILLIANSKSRPKELSSLTEMLQDILDPKKGFPKSARLHAFRLLASSLSEENLELLKQNKKISKSVLETLPKNSALQINSKHAASILREAGFLKKTRAQDSSIPKNLPPSSQKSPTTIEDSSVFTSAQSLVPKVTLENMNKLFERAISKDIDSADFNNAINTLLLALLYTSDSSSKEISNAIIAKLRELDAEKLKLFLSRTLDMKEIITSSSNNTGETSAKALTKLILKFPEFITPCLDIIENDNSIGDIYKIFLLRELKNIKTFNVATLRKIEALRKKFPD